MTTIQRLTNSCVRLTSESGTTLFDPGFFTWGSARFDLDGLGDVQRVLVTHAHADHVQPDFVRWLVDRGDDVTVHANPDVVALLAEHDLEAHDLAPAGASFQDVLHEAIPTGDTPPNRSWTVDGAFTHPGDSYEPTTTAPVMALPLLTPWGSTTASVAFARRLAPQAVFPIHDFYLSDSGRQVAMDLAQRGLADTGIELLRLDWGDAATL